LLPWEYLYWGWLKYNLSEIAAAAVPPIILLRFARAIGLSLRRTADYQ